MITCTKFRLVQKGSLIAFGSIYIDKWGVEIHNCSLNQHGSSKWVNLPSQVYEKDGEKKYSPYITFKDDAVYKKFKEACLEAMIKKLNEQSYPPESEPSQEILDDDILF